MFKNDCGQYVTTKCGFYFNFEHAEEFINVAKMLFDKHHACLKRTERTNDQTTTIANGQVHHYGQTRIPFQAIYSTVT